MREKKVKEKKKGKQWPLCSAFNATFGLTPFDNSFVNQGDESAIEIANRRNKKIPQFENIDGFPKQLEFEKIY